MFGGLIRRRAALRIGEDEFAAESTLFSLSTEVPRPTDKRTDERLRAILPVTKLVTEDGAQHLCRIKNISAGGLMVEGTAGVETNTNVFIEMGDNRRVPGTIVWTRGNSMGVKFDQKVDLRELLAARKPRLGFTPRPPRLEVTCGATVKIGRLYHRVEVQDISFGGLKVEISDWQCVGKSVVITIESLRPLKGKVRWYKAGRAGIVFDRPLTFEELAEWMSKRVEVASAKLGAWDRGRR
jgi:hypothetical protein